MKKSVKIILISIAISIVSAIVIALSLYGFINWFFYVGNRLFYGEKYRIKTEYGDSFTVNGEGFFSDGYDMYDDNSYHIASFKFYHKRDFMLICDSEYFRCYRYKNEYDDFYFFNIKKYDTFFTIYQTEDEYTEYWFKEDKGKYLKYDFLCDWHFMEIVLPYLDEFYHDEMIAVAENMAAGDYESLYEYGLTEEMIDDEESLNEKIRIMEKYLSENSQ